MISLVAEWCGRCDAILRARSNFNFRGGGEKNLRDLVTPFSSFSFFFYGTSLYREIPRPDDNFLLEVRGKKDGPAKRGASSRKRIFLCHGNSSRGRLLTDGGCVNKSETMVSIIRPGKYPPF